MVRLATGLVCVQACCLAPPGVAQAAESPDYFDLSPEELAKVDVVTASLSPQSLDELPASLTVISREQIRESGARNLYELLRLVPGVRIDLGNRGRPVISVRGVRTDSSNHLLFLLDGHVLNEPGNGSAAFLYELTRMPLHNIQRIEVLRGPGSPVFGANAFLGAVNVITRSPRQISGKELSLRSEFDDQGRVGQEVNVLAGGALGEDMAASLNLSMTRRPGETIPVVADAAGRSGEVDNAFRQFDLQARVESRSIRVSGRFSRQTAGEHYGVFYQLAPDDESNFEGGFLELLHSRALGDTAHLKTRVYADIYHGEARISRIPRGSQSPDSPWFGLNASGAYAVLFQDLAKYGLEARFTHLGLAGHRITYGAMLEYQSQFNIRTLRNFVGTSGPFDPLVDISDGENFSRDAHRTVFAPYIEDLWRLSPELNLNLGLRFDHYSDAGASLNPRVGVNWQFHPRYRLHVLWGTAFRAPGFRSMYLDAGSFFGNPELEEERIGSFELGLHAQLGPRLVVDLTLYNNRLDDLIALPANGDRFENISRLSTRGLEMEARYDFLSGASLKASYSYADPYDGDQAAMSVAPRHSATLLAAAPFNGRLDGSVQLYWQSRTSSSGGWAAEPLDAYALLNARLGYRWTPELSVEAAVFNLLDQNYAYPARPGTYSQGLPAPGRGAMLGLKLEL